MFKSSLQIFLLLTFFIVFIEHTAYCDIRLFLFPKITTDNNDIFLKDVALVEGNNTDIEKIKNTKIKKEIYSDGYIDRKEILSVLKNNTDDNIFIIGNAVRVFNNATNIIYVENQPSEPVIKKGDNVNVIVKKNGISVILRGTAVSDGKIDDEVSVKLEKRSNYFKLVKGIIKSKDYVEVNL